MQTMQDEKEKCKFCGKLFSRARDLETHIHAIHGGSSLMEHLRTKNSTIKDLAENIEPDSVHEGPSLIRERKPIDFTMEDLEVDKEGEGDLDFKIDKRNKKC